MFPLLPFASPAWHPSRVDLLLAEDGDLPESQLARTRVHLRTCPECRAVIADIDELAGHCRDTIDPLDLARLDVDALAPVRMR